MAITTNKTVLFIKKETTAGTPVDPTSGADSVALQTGFSMSPDFAQIESNELNAGITKKPPSVGAETGTASVSHYVRHSGVEGTEPTLSELLEAALGEVVAATTERLTTSGSTAGTEDARGIIKMASGGSDYYKGKAFLIKDTTSGYSIRNVYSMSSNDATLLFNLATAPATGMALGKAIVYKCLDTKPAYSMHLYRGGDGAHDVLSGAKCVSFSMDIAAGQDLNGNFDFEGTGYYFDPIRIESADRYLDFYDGSTNYAVAVEAKLYRSPHELAQALEDGMNATASVDTFKCRYEDRGTHAGKFRFETSGATLSLKWNTGTNTANTIGDKIGYSIAADDTGATLYRSDNVQDWSAPYDAVADTDTTPINVKNNELMLGHFNNYLCSGAASATLAIDDEIFDVEDICAASGIDEKIATGKTVTLEVLLNLKQHEAKNWEQYRTQEEIQMAFNAGPKVGGNYVPGFCVNLCFPRCKIVDFSVEGDEVVQLSMVIQAYNEGTDNSAAFLNLL